MVKIDLISQETVMLARSIFGYDFAPLHRPVFEGNERQYLIDCLVMKNSIVDVSAICREVSTNFNFRIAKSIQMNNSLLSFYFSDNCNPLDIVKVDFFSGLSKGWLSYTNTQEVLKKKLNLGNITCLI
jgi:hypothetical protein